MIMATSETLPLLIAAKYAQSPISVARNASAAKTKIALKGTVLIWHMLPSINIQPNIISIVKVVLIDNPTIGFISFNPILTNIGVMPQQNIPNNANKKTIEHFPFKKDSIFPSQRFGINCFYYLGL
jgi:hypothetical protein